MSVTEVSSTASFPGKVFIAALVNFGPSRSKTWRNSSHRLFKVHSQGPDWADVTEGTAAAGIWQRYRYNWSTPGLVRLTVLDSNSFGDGSYWEYRVTDDEVGGTTIDLFIKRVPSTTKGRIFDVLMPAPISRFFFGRDLKRTVRLLERQQGKA